MSRQMRMALKHPNLPEIRLPALPASPFEYLLHKDELRQPVKVEIPRWSEQGPGPGKTETLQLYFWNMPLGDPRRVTWPLQDPDLEFEIPADKVIPGSFPLYYTLIDANDNGPLPSYPILIKGDETPPRLHEASLHFQKTTVTDKDLTQDLGAHTYINPLPELEEDSTVIWYLGTGPAPDNEVDRLVYKPGDPLNRLLDQSHFRALGSASAITPCYARFRVSDRAGNLSDFSADALINVDLRPVQRNFGPIVVEGLSASEPRLDLSRYPNGLVLKIPDGALVHDDEPVQLEWRHSPQEDWQILMQTTGQKTMHLPAGYYRSLLGKLLYLRYAVQEGDYWHHPEDADVRRLNVDPVDTRRMPPLRCEKISGNGALSEEVLASGASLGLSLPAFPFMTADLKIITKLIGRRTVILFDGPVEPGPVIPAGALTLQALDDAQVQRNDSFTISYEVTFNESTSAGAVYNLKPKLLA